MNETLGQQIARAMAACAQKLSVAGAILVCIEDGFPPKQRTYDNLYITENGKSAGFAEIWIEDEDPSLVYLRKHVVKTWSAMAEMLQAQVSNTKEAAVSHPPAYGRTGKINRSLRYYVVFSGGDEKQNLAVCKAGVRVCRKTS